MSAGGEGLSLPLGSRRAVDMLNGLDKKKFAKLSQRILDALPVDDPRALFTDEERTKLLTVFRIESIVDLNRMIAVGTELWRQIAFRQLKLEPLTLNLSKLGFSESTIETVVEVWSEFGLQVSDRLRGVSFSGLPQLLDVNWTLRMNTARRNAPKVRKPTVLLELVTDSGPKTVEMCREELTELFQTLQTVQERVDTLLQ